MATREPAVKLIPDSRIQQAHAAQNRLLEQSMEYLGKAQRRAATEKKDDLDGLISAITRLSTSITQVVRLHHQILHTTADPDDVSTILARYIDLDNDGQHEQETP